MSRYGSQAALCAVALALTAGVAHEASATCTVRGQYAYGEIVYIGNAFTSVDGGISSSDHVSLYLPVSRCLRPNHTYSIGKVVGVGGDAEVGTQQSFVWQISQGASGAKVSGSVTTDASALPGTWSITFTQGTKRNTTLTIQTQNIPGTGIGDVGQGSSNGVTGYGFNSDDAGTWYQQ